MLECEHWNTVLREYRMILFGKGSGEKRDGGAAGTIDWETAQKVLEEGGRLPISTILRCRVRYFTDGAALGSPGFVAATLRQYQKLTGSRGRQKEPRPMKGADWQDLCTLRGLRREVFG